MASRRIRNVIAQHSHVRFALFWLRRGVDDCEMSLLLYSVVYTFAHQFDFYLPSFIDPESRCCSVSVFMEQCARKMRTGFSFSSDRRLINARINWICSENSRYIFVLKFRCKVDGETNSDFEAQYRIDSDASICWSRSFDINKDREQTHLHLNCAPSFHRKRIKWSNEQFEWNEFTCHSLTVRMQYYHGARPGPAPAIVVLVLANTSYRALDVYTTHSLDTTTRTAVADGAYGMWWER